MKSRTRDPDLCRSVGPSLMLALAFLGGCGGAEITSRWRTGNVVINGENTGWFASAVPLRENHTSIVAMNDGEFLYVGLRTTSRDLQRQVMRQGITWWFDSEGGDQKKFGIHDPVGGAYGVGMPLEGEDTPEEEGAGIRDVTSMNTGELDIYPAGEGQSRRMTKMATGGIDTRVHRSRDTLYYELQVPLNESGRHPFAIGVRPGTWIGVGLESAMKRIREDSRGNTTERGGGPPGGGGGGRGRRGVRPDRREPDTPPTPISTWAKIQLASESAPSP